MGTGFNSLGETINLMKVATTLGFAKFLIMPPAFYKYEDKDVINYYSIIVEKIPESKIILYNFGKLCGYMFSEECVKELVKKLVRAIEWCCDNNKLFTHVCCFYLLIVYSVVITALYIKRLFRI